MRDAVVARGVVRHVFAEHHCVVVLEARENSVDGCAFGGVYAYHNAFRLFARGEHHLAHAVGPRAHGASARVCARRVFCAEIVLYLHDKVTACCAVVWRVATELGARNIVHIHLTRLYHITVP